jgi:hypothetical protein
VLTKTGKPNAAATDPGQALNRYRRKKSVAGIAQVHPRLEGAPGQRYRAADHGLPNDASCPGFVNYQNPTTG